MTDGAEVLPGYGLGRKLYRDACDLVLFVLWEYKGSMFCIGADVVGRGIEMRMCSQLGS